VRGELAVLSTWEWGEMEEKRFHNVLRVTRTKALESKGAFVGIFFALSVETFLALLMPQILSEVLDNLSVRSNEWLAAGALAFCVVVVLRGMTSVCNTYLSERLGWFLCDYLREDVFGIIFQLSVSTHKRTKSGEFLERIEGDINILVGFFSSMFVDIIGSILMVAGILAVFCLKSWLLGAIFFVITCIILLLFVRTQGNIASLWRAARGEETQVLGEYLQDIRAHADVVGMQREDYIMDRFQRKFEAYERQQVRASFFGNIPSTIFYSLLNVGEGIVLAIGFFLLRRGELTIGSMYLILSYVGLLNVPFFNLKYEFAQLPKVLATLARVDELYGMEEQKTGRGTEKQVANGDVVFEDVSFGYEENRTVLENVNFTVHSGEKVLIEGRTGSGKSTVLQLIAGLYEPGEGKIKVGGHEIRDYQTEAYNRAIAYIFQSNPVINDTIKNNITRYDGRYSEAEVLEAIRAVELDQWFLRENRSLETVITAGDVSHDEAQLMAWAGALLARPKVLLVDEFDASIHEGTVRIIDRILEKHFSGTTVIMVSHKFRSSVEIQRTFLVDAGHVSEVER